MNFDVEKWDALVADLYLSLLDPDLLPDAVQKANTALESDLCHVVGFTPQGRETVRIFTERDMGTVGDLYAGYYNRIDPRRQFIETAAVGVAYRCSAFYDARYVSGSEFYQDFLIPQGFRYVIGSCLYRSAEQNIFVAFNHRRGRRDFCADEEQFIKLYIGHLSRTVGAIVKLEPVAQALDSETALEALQYGVLGVTSAGAIAYTNPRAEAFLLSHLHCAVARGRLRDGTILGSAVGQVLADGQPRSLVMAGAATEPPLFISVIRAKPGAAQALVRGGDSVRSCTRVMLIMRAGLDAPAPSQLMAMFGLSPAEARLAHQVAGGLSLHDYADRFHVSVATARTQLRAVLRKTGAGRQQDLLRLLAAIPVGKAG